MEIELQKTKKKSEPDSSQFARWLAIKRLSMVQMARLHEIERKAFQLGWERTKARKLLTDESDWKHCGINYMIIISQEFGHFWPYKSELAWRSEETQKFIRLIYPIWRPIWDHYDDTWDMLPEDKKYFGEIDAVHLIDQKIHAMFYKFPPSKMPKPGEVADDALKEDDQTQH